jgi:hypothetical protein
MPLYERDYRHQNDEAGDWLRSPEGREASRKAGIKRAKVRRKAKRKEKRLQDNTARKRRGQ